MKIIQVLPILQDINNTIVLHTNIQAALKDQKVSTVFKIN
jgi:hypothetical protein